MGLLDRFRLDDRVAIVTGASGGLGVDIARGLAEAGADVVIAARRADRLEETLALIRTTGRRGLAVPADVSRPEDCARVVAAASEAFGRLDILVNNAGVGEVVPALNQSPDAFRRLLDINLAGAHWMACAAVEAMHAGGSIINVSSVLALTTANIPQAAYAASKAGLLGLTRDLSHEWAGRRNVRVNAVAPGWFASEMTAGSEEVLAKLVQRSPLARLGEPEELAAAIVFLASDAASYMTGATLVVDGGFSLG
jgi:NAD(P)-dependent dehydrogenase (short-subunit alcohol dehydrogenase family)